MALVKPAGDVAVIGCNEFIQLEMFFASRS